MEVIDLDRVSNRYPIENVREHFFAFVIVPENEIVQIFFKQLLRSTTHQADILFGERPRTFNALSMNGGVIGINEVQ